MSLTAIWSFWTKPYFASRRSTWHHELHHWLAWGLSLRLASRHYPETWLYTDDAGARILIEELNLPFTHVSTVLNKIEDEDPEWWALGKIEAYRRHQDPFVHIDTDVFLWNRLPRRLEDAPVLAQSPEPIILGNSWYRPEVIEDAIGSPHSGWLPPEWTAARVNTAACCGIFGGNCLEFIHRCANAARNIVVHCKNRAEIAAIEHKNEHMILLEQYLVTAAVEYHRQHSRFPGIRIEYLFETMDDAYRPESATIAGFTHLASDAKRNSRMARDLEDRMRAEDLDYYDRCVAYAGHAGSEQWSTVEELFEFV